MKPGFLWKKNFGTKGARYLGLFKTKVPFWDVEKIIYLTQVIVNLNICFWCFGCFRFLGLFDLLFAIFIRAFFFMKIGGDDGGGTLCK